jgi:trimeric autotransporter adhesin
MRRFSTNITLALSILFLLFASISSAQQTSVQPDASVNTLSIAGKAGNSANPGPPSATNNFIPYFVTNTGYTDSILFQPNTTVINDNGNFNLTNPANAYQIGNGNVLRITGTKNLFVGIGAGAAPPSGNGQNTFVGFDAGFHNTTGFSNTFVGMNAGFNNTASGSSYNTFLGTNAGYSDSTAGGNSFLGYSAGSGTTTGYANTFSGYNAGRSNTTGIYNVIYGYNAGFNTGNATTGSSNTYLGTGAGSSVSGLLTSGSNNIFVGFNAGNAENNVSNNIEVGNTGPAPGSNTILIGTQGMQTSTYIAGIFPVAVPNANPVCVQPTGQLGVCGSSRRFKENIRDMGDSTSNLMKLRPVTYLYKPEYDKGPRSLQYGLIAEEVAEVYPDLVAYEPDGKPLTVNYQNLTAMLLNELQKQRRSAAAQAEVVQSQQQEIEGLKAQLQLQNASFQERLSRVESVIGTQMKTAAAKSPQPTVAANGGLQ